MARLEVRELSVRFGHGTQSLMALREVSLKIAAGATLGVVGESGSGKSTLARAIVGHVPLHAGQILLDGDDCSATKIRGSAMFRSRVQMVYQDPAASFNPRMNIGDAMRDALRPAAPGMGRADITQACVQLLAQVGLAADALQRFPHQFSGGQRQRIAIARALAARPDILILDEVTSSLDVSVQAAILNLLRDLQERLGLSYLFISHDLSVVRYMSDTMAVMYLGQVVEAGDSETLLAHPAHPYTQALLQSVPRIGAPRAAPRLLGEQPDPRSPPAGCLFHTRCPVGGLACPERVACVAQVPELRGEPMRRVVACHFPVASEDQA